MTAASAFRLSTTMEHPQDANVPAGTPAEQLTQVSAFVTVQALSNFAVMTAAILTAWKGLEITGTWADTRYLPFGLCLAYGIVAVVISKAAWKAWTDWIPGLFVAVINALVLFAAVVGTGIAARV